MNGALWFLVTRSVRNRVGRQLARVRQPRYAVAMVAGLVFVWFVYLRPQGGPSSARVPSSSGTAPAFAAAFTVIFALQACYWWLRGGVHRSLAFQAAEVQFLFTAPLSRRTLVAYRLVRLQLLLLVSALIWAVILRQWRITLPAPLRFATAWAVFSVLTMHRLLIALMRVEPISGARRWLLGLAKLLAVAVLAMLVVGLAPPLMQLGRQGIGPGMDAVQAALAAPPVSWALAPFRLTLAPLGAASTREWAVAFGGVVALALVHLAAILSLRVPFEETAAAATEEMTQRLAALRARRAGISVPVSSKRAKRDWFPLRPTGHPAVAIAWKNSLALLRGGGATTAIIMAVLVAAAAAVVPAFAPRPSAEHARDAAMAAMIPTFMILFMSLALGPRAIRNDLRQDLLSLALLKTYPLSGRQIVVAELISPTVALTLFQVVLLAVAAGTMPTVLRSSIPAGLLMSGLLAAPVVLAVLNAANIAIQNGGALTFPAWVRLGSDTGGVEALGQNLLFTVGALLALALSLIVPLAVGGTVAFLARPLYGSLTMVAGALAGALVLGVEVWLLALALGRVLDRTEPDALT